MDKEIKLNEKADISKIEEKNNSDKTNNLIIEQWDKDFICEFVLQLYLKQHVSLETDLNAPKKSVRDEFEKFLNLPENENFRDKFKYSNIGSLLYQLNFLVQTKQGSDFYLLKYVPIDAYRKKKINRLDSNVLSESVIERQDLLIWLKAHSHTNMESNYEDEAIDNEIGELFKIIKSLGDTLEYIETQMHEAKEIFKPLELSCAICGINFTKHDEYEMHINFHSKESHLRALKGAKKFSSAIFEMWSKFVKDYDVYCFAFETKLQNLAIDKIIIIQQRKMFELDINSVIFLQPTKEQGMFAVKKHIFTEFLEQPIVFVFKYSDFSNVYIVEQHNFMRIDKIQALHDQLENENLMFHVKDEKISCDSTQFPVFAPLADVRHALKQQNSVELLNKISHQFHDYISNDKTLTSNNICQALNLILQVEDIDIMMEYFDLIQRHVKLRKSNETFAFKFKTSKSFHHKNVVSITDEFLLIPEGISTNSFQDDSIWDLITNSKKYFVNAENDEIKPVVGLLKCITNDYVIFVSRENIDVEKSYMVIPRSQRLSLRYQYHALTNLPLLSLADINRLLFPNFVKPYDLKFSGLNLQNKLLYENREQLQAIRNIHDGPHKDATYIINGGPGTGKTALITEAILQLYIDRPTAKILVTCGTDSACDAIALPLSKVFTSIKDKYAMARIYNEMGPKDVAYVERQLLAFANYKANGEHFFPNTSSLQEYRIIVCTLDVIGRLNFSKLDETVKSSAIFSHVFIDNANTLTESETIVGIMGLLAGTGCLILSGDLKQLGPKIYSKRAEEYGMKISLMERLLSKCKCYQLDNFGNYNPAIQTRLQRNYRSHPEIVKLCNNLFYKNELIAMVEDDKADDSLNVYDICRKWHRAQNHNYPILFHSVYGTTMREKLSKSIYNLREIDVVMDYVKDLMFFGINGFKFEQSDIGIITPFTQQCERIREELNLRSWNNIEIGTAEAYHGKEKHIIIVSFVCSYMPLYMLNCSKQLCSTLSRAKSLLILIGNQKTLKSDKNLKYIIEECRKNNMLIDNLYQNIKEKNEKIEYDVVGSENKHKLVNEKYEIKKSKSIENLDEKGNNKEMSEATDDVDEDNDDDDNDENEIIVNQTKGATANIIKENKFGKCNKNRNRREKFKATQVYATGQPSNLLNQSNTKQNQKQQNNQQKQRNDRNVSKTEVEKLFEELPKLPKPKVDNEEEKHLQEMLLQNEIKIYQKLRELKINTPEPSPKELPMKSKNKEKNSKLDDSDNKNLFGAIKKQRTQKDVSRLQPHQRQVGGVRPQNNITELKNNNQRFHDKSQKFNRGRVGSPKQHLQQSQPQKQQQQQQLEIPSRFQGYQNQQDSNNQNNRPESYRPHRSLYFTDEHKKAETNDKCCIA